MQSNLVWASLLLLAITAPTLAWIGLISLSVFSLEEKFCRVIIACYTWEGRRENEGRN